MIKNLQALRFVFSFCILVSHLLGQQLSTFGLGEYGVCGFFILSGFILSIAYGRKIDGHNFTTRQFFFKQWAKLYPLHLATFLLAIIYDAHYGISYHWGQLVPPVFLVQGWIPDSWFHYIPNGSSWSLCSFFFFYLLFSTLYLFFNRLSTRKLTAILAVGIAGYLILVISLPESLTYSFVYISPLMRLPEFILGISLSRLVRSDFGEKAKQWFATCSVWKLSVIEAIALVCPVITFLAYGYLLPSVRCVSLFWPFVGLQLLLFTWGDSAKGLVTRLLHTRPVMFLGGISFEIYLTHMFVVPVARSMAFKLGYNPTGILALALALSVAIPLAWSAKRWVVEPAFHKLYTRQ